MKSRHDCKLFIGGISARCESAELIEYFSKFGQVKNLKLTRNKQTGRCQGYGYLELGSHQTYSNILSAGEHIFQGRTIDVKKMIAKEKLQAEVENERNRRMFVGSLHPKTSNESLKGYFCQFGKPQKNYLGSEKKIYSEKLILSLMAKIYVNKKIHLIVLSTDS